MKLTNDLRNILIVIHFWKAGNANDFPFCPAIDLSKQVNKALAPMHKTLRIPNLVSSVKDSFTLINFHALELRSKITRTSERLRSVEHHDGESGAAIPSKDRDRHPTQGTDYL